MRQQATETVSRVIALTDLARLKQRDKLLLIHGGRTVQSVSSGETHRHLRGGDGRIEKEV